MGKSINISKQLDVRSVCANIDILYGPYNSITEACEVIPIGRRAVGRTVGIINNGNILEYWWKSGIEDKDLVQKVEQLSLALHLYGDDDITVEEGGVITAQFIVEGGAGIKRAVLYQVMDGSEVYIQDYSNIGKGIPVSFTIPTPSLSGVYVYHLKVLDSLDNYAIAEDNTNFIEYTVRYGGLTTIFNFTKLNAITVKNFNSVAGVPFQINIAVRDSSFAISSVYLTNQHEPEWTDPESRVEIELYAYDDAQGQHRASTLIGNHYFFMPDSSLLKKLDGQLCTLSIRYSEGVSAREKTEDMFRLLSVSSLELIPESEGSDYYVGIPGQYVFQLQAGVENLSISLLPGEGSDFDFERCTVMAYRRFSLKVVAHDNVKKDAHIVINYVFNYGGTDYTGTFSPIIGNIVPVPEQSFYTPPTGGLVNRLDVVVADASHNTGVDQGQYYLLIPDSIKSTDIPAGQGLYTPSFVIDTYCKINQLNDKEVKYLSVTYGDLEIIRVTEDEIATQWGGLYTDTPLNEWTQIGVGINLEETVSRGDTGDVIGSYHAIYINGMVVKTIIVSDMEKLRYDPSKELIVTIGNGIIVQKCFLYYRNNGQEIMSPNVFNAQGQETDIPIIYNNYKSHKLNFKEPEEGLPLLKFMRIPEGDELAKYYRLINTYKDDNDEDVVKYITTFGKIGDTKAQSMNAYDSGYNSSATWQSLLENNTYVHNNAKLFRQHVDIKKPAQKEYGVLCRAQWMGNVYQDIVVEVHTQGTSTLRYAVPNFKFTFWQLYQDSGGEKVRRFEPEFIKIEGSDDDYYKESIYTAKADFMDSAHLNNTPTCNYYNGLIQTLINDDPDSPDSFKGSPSARNGKLDAIMGFPIVMEISDTATGFDDIFTNIGSFMLNIDKTGDSLGFDIVDEDLSHMTCVSFEGTSNDNSTGAAGRFDIPTNMVDSLPPYITGQNEIDVTEIREQYTFAKNNIIKKNQQKRPDDTIEYKGKTMFVKNFPYVAWCKFLSDGLEYRYPDSDIYKEDGVIKKLMDSEDFIRLYTMWWWVYTSDTLDNDSYKEQFAQHFNVDYCKLYFIQLMIYAQTDNLGKNAMFDYWYDANDPINPESLINKGCGRWYPRPYDLDSEAGLDNNGNDNVATFAEIKPIFSLNYNIDKEDDWEWRAANYLIDTNDVEEHPEEHLTESKIQYGNHEYKRYHFSSNKSKLWITFYKNFKTEIEALYSKLRLDFAYNPESIISLCQKTLIDKLGTNQYNLDFKNKYLATQDQAMAYGNRWYKFKKWLTKRFAFCDSYFGAANTANYNIVNRISYQVKVDSPQYVWQQYQSNPEVKFVLNSTEFSTGSSGATAFTLFVNQPSVFETTLFKFAQYNSGATNYNNLIKLDVSTNRNEGFTNITSLTGPNLDNLKWLNISDSNVQTLNLPPNVKTLLANRVKLNTFTIPEGSAAEEMSFVGTTFATTVSFSDIYNLKSLDISDCVFENNVTFAGLPNLENLKMDRTVFKGQITISENVNVSSFDFHDLTIGSISFSGTSLGIKKIDFRNVTFTNSSVLNLGAIIENIEELLFDNCKGLTHLQLNFPASDSKFESLNCLSLKNSSIKSLGQSEDTFDCSYLNMPNKNMSELKQYGNSPFTFQNCEQIEKITNINWNGTGLNLFHTCQNLVSITGTITFKKSVDYAFFKCNKLTTLPNYTITSDNSNDKVISANSTFRGCRELDYSVIQTFISRCTKVTDFSYAVASKQMPDGQVINLNTLFSGNNDVQNISSMFSLYDARAYDPQIVTNSLIFQGRLPVTATNASWMFYGNTLSVPYDILYGNGTGSPKLATANHMFCGCTVKFTEPTASDVNQPTIVDGEEPVVIDYAIDNEFFKRNKNEISNISRMFLRSNVIAKDNELFRGFTKLTDTSSAFAAGGLRKFTYTLKNQTGDLPAGTVIDLPLNVINMWNDCPNISNISGCFANVYNVYCDGLNFSKTSGTIDISCLFSVNDATHRDEYEITVDTDALRVTLLTRGQYFDVSTNSNGGTFKNRTINLLSNNETIFSNGKIMYGDCTRTFSGANIRLPVNVKTLNLSSVTNCTSLFEESRLYLSSSETGHVYGINDRKFVYVTMPTSCGIYSYMFANSSILRDLPALRSANTSSTNYMYAGCVITNNDLRLSPDYFDICRNTIANTSYMFQYNMYLTQLEYDENKGLFQDCVNLSNVSNMFEYTYFLHKGVPNNIFGKYQEDPTTGEPISGTPLTKLTSLQYMFGTSGVLYDIDDFHKCITSETFTPLTKLSDIPGMFRRTYIRTVSTGDPDYGHLYNVVEDQSTSPATRYAPIAPSTWIDKKLNNITKLFEHSLINPPQDLGPWQFKSFTIGTDAFFNCGVSYISEDAFVSNDYISSIARADRMFYQSPAPGPHRGGSISGLPAFINKIKNYPNTNKNNIAGGLEDPEIPENYKQKLNTLEGEENRYYGYELQYSTDVEAETYRTRYGNYPSYQSN